MPMHSHAPVHDDYEFCIDLAWTTGSVRMALACMCFRSFRGRTVLPTSGGNPRAPACSIASRQLHAVNLKWWRAAAELNRRQQAQPSRARRDHRVMLSYCSANGRRRWRQPFARSAQLDRLALCLRQDAQPRDILQGVLQAS